MTMFCVMNENRRGGFGGNVHIRQLKETEDGNRSPMLRDNRAIIEVVSDNYYIARATSGEVIGISDIFTNVLARINYAQTKATINVVMNGETLTLEQYHEISAPTVYRLQHSASQKHGVIVAMSIYRSGKTSKSVFYDNTDEALDFIAEQQTGSNYYYVATGNRIVLNEVRERALGMVHYEASDKERDFTQLKDEIKGIRGEQDKKAIAYE